MHLHVVGMSDLKNPAVRQQQYVREMRDAVAIRLTIRIYLKDGAHGMFRNFPSHERHHVDPILTVAAFRRGTTQASPDVR